jgi:hypothetical protein
MSMAAECLLVGITCVVTCFVITGLDTPEAIFARTPLDRLMIAQQMLLSAIYLFFPAALVFWSLGL